MAQQKGLRQNSIFQLLCKLLHFQTFTSDISITNIKKKKRKKNIWKAEEKLGDAWPSGINKNLYSQYSPLPEYPGKSLPGNPELLLLYSDKYNGKFTKSIQRLLCKWQRWVWVFFCFLLSLLDSVVRTSFLSDRGLRDFPLSFSSAPTSSSHHFLTKKRSNKRASGRQKCWTQAWPQELLLQ